MSQSNPMTDTQLEDLAWRLARMRVNMDRYRGILAALQSVQNSQPVSPADPLGEPADAANRDRAIEQIMIGGNHLASALIGWLGAGEPGFPPYSASLEDARKAIPDVDKYDAWVCWKFIMLARDQMRPAAPEQSFTEAERAPKGTAANATPAEEESNAE